MTVEQAIAVAGGLTERGSDRRIKVARLVGGKRKEVDVKLTDKVLADDTITNPAALLLIRCACSEPTPPTVSCA